MQGTLIYLGLFAMIRFLAQREVGSFGVTDLLVIVLTISVITVRGEPSNRPKSSSPGIGA